jgi:hypothetical protein
MCLAHNKDVHYWLIQDSTRRIVFALAKRLGIEIKTQKNGDSVTARLSDLFPSLLIVRRGSPSNGGGTWIHYKLAVNLAQWCNEDFALLVSDWVEEWLTTGKNPFQPNLDQEFIFWQQRHDIRVYLKDFLRTELMNAVVRYALENKLSPIKLCSQVHDQMNLRIQGLNAKQIKELNGLPLGKLLRDHFAASPLVTYSAINKLATNAIQDKKVDPVTAVNTACDSFLGIAYVPTPVPICENLYSAENRIRSAHNHKKLSQGTQLSLFDRDQSA